MVGKVRKQHGNGQWSAYRSQGGRISMLFEQLILYPLNALVEDQLRRLRSTLDSDSDHSWNIHHWLEYPTWKKPDFIWSVYRTDTRPRGF